LLTAYFCGSRKSQVKYNCAHIKVDWLAACIALRVVGVVSSGVSVKFAQSASQWEARADTLRNVPNMVQTLLSNKKQGNVN
jgi:hypothetical protein